MGASTKRKDLTSVTRHKANIHDIDVVYFLCDVDECEYKAKVPGSVKQHKANIHDIDVVYYLCGVNRCYLQGEGNRCSENTQSCHSKY